MRSLPCLNDGMTELWWVGLAPSAKLNAALLVAGLRPRTERPERARVCVVASKELPGEPPRGVGWVWVVPGPVAEVTVREAVVLVDLQERAYVEAEHAFM